LDNIFALWRGGLALFGYLNNGWCGALLCCLAGLSVATGFRQQNKKFKFNGTIIFKSSVGVEGGYGKKRFCLAFAENETLVRI